MTSPLIRAGIPSSFRTDADISGSLNRGERPLQPWVPDASMDVDLSLDSSGRKDWDQFETNKRLFGASSTYDENLYTTRIDRSAPTYRHREAAAARIAREIEGTASTNTHLREERGQAVENDGEDEEDKYSGVRRDDLNFPPLASGAANVYTPPARRAPTGQPTVAGAPVDPAIISAQIARPEEPHMSKPAVHTDREEDDSGIQVNLSNAGNAPTAEELQQNADAAETVTTPTESLAVNNKEDSSGKLRPLNTSVSPQRKLTPENPTEDVENKVLDAFRQFGTSEKLKYQERRRMQANHDRTAKLNDLKRFSTTFKLRTPVPTDLVGILAKDPVKQEKIVEKAQKEHEEQASVSASPASRSSSNAEVKTPQRPTGAGKAEASTLPPQLADRQLLARGRQGYPTFVGRNERPLQPQAVYAGRGTSGLFSHRSSGSQQERKPLVPPEIPTPIPILESRQPPTGPAGDQSGLTSPQRSSVHTPTSAVSMKFNVKALEFRPNAAAPAFNPAAASNPPSSPRSMARTRSVSRATSPSSFFGSRKPMMAADRPQISNCFNPIKRMMAETAAQKDQHKKDYSSNGGIPYAYQTGPVWEVKEENKEKSYTDVFERLSAPAPLPAQPSRTNSSHQVPYQHQMSVQLQNGHHNTPQMSASHHSAQHVQVAHHTPHFDEAPHRMHIPASSPQVYPSPRLPNGQMVYASPMGHPAQLAYGQPVQQFYASQGGPAPVQMRQYPGAPQFIHSQGGQLAAPIMIQQQSSGPYLAMPQQYTPQMQMYSPSPGHAYPQHVAQPHSGYPSPSRGAPMMMHQGSQQSHHPGQAVMYALPNQPGQMGYPQQGGHMGPMRGAYPTQQGPYGSSPHQSHHFPPQPHRAPSSGYGQISQKMLPQQMQPGQGPPPNAPHQPSGYDLSEEAK